MTHEDPAAERPAVTLGVPEASQWLLRARAVLEHHRERLNELNVFPVPDADTGTNMFLTVHAAVLDVLRRPPLPAAAPLSSRFNEVACAMLVHARGNSGVILAQLVMGLAAGLAEAEAEPSEESATAVDARSISVALTRASEHARGAVADPVDGTILTVIDAAADAAAVAAHAEHDVARVIEAAVDAARVALAATTAQLPALHKAGVVDAGGAGLVLVLEALLDVLQGTPEAAPDSTATSSAGTAPHSAAASAGATWSEVMYLLLGASEEARSELREHLRHVGESVIVAGSDAVCTVHVHTTNPGAAIEAGVQAGNISNIAVTWLPTPTQESADEGSAASEDEAVRGVCVICEADGHVASWSEVAGVHVQEFTDAETAQVAQRRSSITVVVGERAAAALKPHAATVVPLDHAVQAVAALAVYDPAAPVAQAAQAMREASWHMNVGEVRAESSHAHDFLGMIDGAEVTRGSQLESVACDIASSLATPSSELITVLTTSDAQVHHEQLLASLSGRLPHCEITHHTAHGLSALVQLGVE